MSNDYFQFRRFTVCQDKCAMKVGTDGTLLGAWAHGGDTILDIGTGTGLIALMMAQRYDEARIVAIDIDGDACQQALENVSASPFGDRIEVLCSAVQDYAGAAVGSFKAIVSNPPFFAHSLKNPDPRRAMARHTDSLTPRDLMKSVARMLAPDGEFSLIVPSESRDLYDTEAAIAGLFAVRVCAVSTTPTKAPRRYLLAYRRAPQAVEERALVIGSSEYRELTEQFYL